MKNLFLLSAFMIVSCNAFSQDGNSLTQKEKISFPELFIFNDEFNSYFSGKNKIEKIVSNQYWLEGPVWVESLNGLLFSDIPENRIYFWNKEKGLSLWLEPAGFSNGLQLDNKGDLIVMQGNYESTSETKRQVGKIVNPASNKTIHALVTNYNGKKFNSPNDVVCSSNGILYFTDPAYGLTKGNNDPLKELTFNGVYQFKNNKTTLLIDSIGQPNGIGLSPDSKFLYVADSEKGRLITYELNKEGDIINTVNFFELKNIRDRVLPLTFAAFDGMTVSKKGVIIICGYNGIWFISPKGILLGHIQTPEFTSNCALDTNEEYLYWTSGKYPFEKGSSSLCRYKL